MDAYLDSKERILVVIGPSGSGKSSVIGELHDRGIVAVTPSWTTRPPRQEEAERSVEHVFVDSEEFGDKEREGYFLRTVALFGLPHKYGLPRIKRPSAGRIPTVMLRAPVMSMVPEFYPNTVVYQIEDTADRVRRRLAGRESRGERLGTRMADYRKEVDLGRDLAARTFVNSGSVTELADQVSRALEKDFGAV